MPNKEPSKLKYTLNDAQHYLSLSCAMAEETGNLDLAAKLQEILDKFYQTIKEIS